MDTVSLIQEDKKILEIVWGKGTPVTSAEISKKIGVNVRSVNVHLWSLRREGLVLLSEGGWIISAQGKEAIGFPKIDEKLSKKILSKTPLDAAFQFYTGIDQPLGTFSDSLIDFSKEIGSIDIRSIEFHTARGDFESWINRLGDVELARKVGLIREENLTGEKLREKLYGTLLLRCEELKREAA